MFNIDAMIRYENGELPADETLDFFAQLIASGQVWTLQGSYGRTASSLIAAGLITTDGVVTTEGRDLVASLA